MATDSILPGSIQKFVSFKSSYDDKLTEQLKAINEAMSHFERKYGTPLQLNSDWPALLKASYQNDFEKVKHLSSGKCVITIVAEDGWTALTVASSMGHINVVKFLIEHTHGGEVNTGNFTALMGACRYGHYEVVKLLLAHGAKPNIQTSSLELGDPTMTALMQGTISNSYQIVKLLLDYGAETNVQCDVTGVSALTIAVQQQSYDIAKLLLENGADPNTKLKEIMGVLNAATCTKSHKMVKLLLEKGAQVDLRDESRQTALMEAGCRGLYNIAKLLLDNGASVNLQNVHGSTALRAACFRGHHKVAALLLKRGAQVDIQINDGSTSLSAASYLGYFQVVQLLLQNGAQPNLRNHTGLSALDKACVSGHYDIAKLLIEKGAKVGVINPDLGATLGLPTHWSLVAVVAYYGHYSIVKLLLDNDSLPNSALASIGEHCHQVDICKLLLVYGADPNRLDNGNYPLHYVVGSKETKREVIELLLSRGALPSLKNQEGYSALTEAVLAECNDNVEILLESPLVGKADLWQTLTIAVYLSSGPWRF